MIDVALLCTIFGVFILLSFKLGFKYGLLSKEPETKETPTIKLEPKIIKKKKQEKDESTKEFETLCTAINNLENYKGSSEGQVSIK